MKNLKKKALMAGSYVAVAALAVGGTLAFYTSQDKATNVSTVGEGIKVVLNEEERIVDANGAYTGGLQDFTQGKEMNPAVMEDYNSKATYDVNGYDIAIRDKVGHYTDKIVSVTNEGEKEAYVRTIFAFPEAGDFNTTYNAAEQWFHWNGVSDTDTTTPNGWIWGRDEITEWPGNTDNWDVVENVEINGKKYDVYVVTNKNIIAGNTSTAPAIVGMFLDSAVDCEVGDDGSLNYTFGDYDLGDISQLEVLVLSQACTTDIADNAWDALDEAFGDVDAINAKKWFEEKEEVEAKPASGATRPAGYNPVEEDTNVLDGIVVTDGSDDATNLRALYAGDGNKVSGDFFVMNSSLDGTYAMNIIGDDTGNLYVSNTELKGWVSYDGFIAAEFKNCTFTQNSNAECYKTIRPYSNIVISDSSFEAGYEFWLDKLPEGATITFDNCTIGGVAITSASQLATPQGNAEAIVIK